MASNAKREYDETRSTMGSGHMRSIVLAVGALAYESELKKLRAENEEQRQVIEFAKVRKVKCVECDARKYMPKHTPKGLTFGGTDVNICQGPGCYRYACDKHQYICNHNRTTLCSRCKATSNCFCEQ